MKEFVSKMTSWTQWKSTKRDLSKDMESDGSLKTIKILKDLKIENRLSRDWDQIKMPISIEEGKQNYWISMHPITYPIKKDQL